MAALVQPFRAGACADKQMLVQPRQTDEPWAQDEWDVLTIGQLDKVGDLHAATFPCQPIKWPQATGKLLAGTAASSDAQCGGQGACRAPQAIYMQRKYATQGSTVLSKADPEEVWLPRG